MAGQAVEWLVTTLAVTKPYQGLASLTGAPGRLAASSAVLAWPVTATVTAGTILALVSKAPDEFANASL